MEFTAAEFSAVRSLAADLSGYTLLTRMCDELERQQAMTEIAMRTLADIDTNAPHTNKAEADAQVIVLMHVATRQLRNERPLAA